MVDSEFSDEYDSWLAGSRERLESALYEQPLNDLRYTEPLFMSADTPVADAIVQMAERNKGSVLVGDANGIQGIFTERDVLKRVLAGGGDASGQTLADVMTSNPETLHTSDRIVHALRLMSVGGYRHLPVLGDDDSVVGIVSVKHIVDFVVQLFPAEVLNAPPPGQGYSDEVDGG